MDEQRKAQIQNTFNTVAVGYDSDALRFFRLSAAAHSALLNPGHSHVIDVAAGTGNLALTLAADFPETGVTAVDFSAAMLAQGRQKAAESGLGNVDFVEMDMQDLTFPEAHFDAATCAFGIFFVEDMVTQLAHIASRVKAGGPVITSGFYDTSFSPIADLFFARIEKYGIEPPPLSWKRIDTEDKCRALFEDAGLVDVRVEHRDVGYYLQNAEQWWDVVWFAGFRGLVNQLSEEDLQTFKKDHLAEVQALADAEGIWFNVQVLYTIGTKAGDA